MKSKWITVDDMHKYVKDNNMMLLSSFTATFWNEYRTQHTLYDWTFRQMYKNYRYFDQNPYDEDVTVEDVTEAFMQHVLAHLMLNKKKYEELFRINGLTDDDYPIFNNIDMKEEKHGTYDTDVTNTEGSRSDSESKTMGARTDTTTDTSGSRTDTSEQEVSAFNVNTYAKANKTTDTKGAETDSTNFVKGQEVDNTSTTKGQQVNTTDGTNTEDYTITKTGKMNVLPNQTIIDKHVATWSRYEFYTYIFKEIAKEMLLI